MKKSDSLVFIIWFAQTESEIFKSDKDLFSPNSIGTLSSRHVMGIMKSIS